MSEQLANVRNVLHQVSTLRDTLTPDEQVILDSLLVHDLDEEVVAHLMNIRKEEEDEVVAHAMIRSQTSRDSSTIRAAVIFNATNREYEVSVRGDEAHAI